MKKITALLLAGLLLTLAGCSSATAPTESADTKQNTTVQETTQRQLSVVPDGQTAKSTTPDGGYSIIDSHLHYLDFLQKTDGFEALAKKMDEVNVPYAVIFGMAMAKQWDENAPNEPTYYMSNDSRCYYYSATDYIMMADYMAQPDEVKERFFPFICGINPNDKNAASNLRRLLETYPDDIYGIGEVMSRHDDLTALTYGEPPRADHPAFLGVYDLAAEYDIPVIIHHNIGPSYTDDPIYLQEMKNALAHNRNAVIIWAHTGISRRVEDSKHTQITDEMLKDNPNLYYDISWLVFDDYINISNESLDEWAALIEKYPDRFMIGSDKVGHWKGYEDEILKYYPLIDRLSDETKEKVTKTNILERIHVDPASLERIKPAETQQAA